MPDFQPYIDNAKNTANTIWGNLTRPPQPQQINVQVPREDSHWLENSMMGGGALAAGGGYATQQAGNKLRALGLQGQKMMTPQGRKSLEAFLAGTAEGVPDDAKFKNFINQSHDLLNTDVLRFPGGKRMTTYDVLDKAYTNPAVDKGLQSVIPGYRGIDDKVRTHYKEFSKSPLDAYRQLLVEQYDNKNSSAYLDDIHSLRMSALDKMRANGGKGFYQHLANELKSRANVTGLRPDVSPAVHGDEFFRKALNMESSLRKADPAQYAEWMRAARMSNVGGALDEGALSHLKGIGHHLYGKANMTDVLADQGGFWRTLRPGMKQVGMDSKLMQNVLKTQDLSQIPRPMQQKLLDYITANGPKFQNAETISDLSKSFGSGARMGYRTAAGGALKLHDLAKRVAGIGKGMSRGGKAGLIGGASLAGLGVLGRMFGGRDNYANYSVTVPPRG